MKPKQRFFTGEEIARLNAVLTRDEFRCPRCRGHRPVADAHRLSLRRDRLPRIVLDQGQAHPSSRIEIRAAHGLVVGRRARGHRRHRIHERVRIAWIQHRFVRSGRCGAYLLHALRGQIPQVPFSSSRAIPIGSKRTVPCSPRTPTTSDLSRRQKRQSNERSGRTQNATLTMRVPDQTSPGRAQLARFRAWLRYLDRCALRRVRPDAGAVSYRPAPRPVTPRHLHPPPSCAKPLLALSQHLLCMSWFDPKILFHKRINGLFHDRFTEHTLSDSLEVC